MCTASVDTKVIWPHVTLPISSDAIGWENVLYASLQQSSYIMFLRYSYLVNIFFKLPFIWETPCVIHNVSSWEISIIFNHNVLIKENMKFCIYFTLPYHEIHVWLPVFPQFNNNLIWLKKIGSTYFRLTKHKFGSLY